MSAEARQMSVSITQAPLVRASARDARHAIELAVSCSWVGGAAAMRTTDIGATGMRVTCASALPRDRSLSFEVKVPGIAQGLALPGLVAGDVDGALEIEFTDSRETVR